jgi:hypothetical protein
MPAAMAKTDTSTATTPALPMIITDDVPSRCDRLRKFIAVTEAICEMVFMRISYLTALFAA